MMSGVSLVETGSISSRGPEAGSRYLMRATVWLKKVLGGEARGSWGGPASSSHFPSPSPGVGSRTGPSLGPWGHCPGVSAGSSPCSPTPAHMTIRLHQVNRSSCHCPAPFVAPEWVRGPGEARPHTLRAREWAEGRMTDPGF